MRKHLVVLAVVLLVVCVVAGCARPYPLERPIYERPAGFWYGLWHGIVVCFSFVGSLFDDGIAVYSVYNSGSWYDFGFLVGVGAFASSASSRVKKSE